MRNVLITNDEVVFHAPTKQTVDVRIIQQSIMIAEERFIRPALGFDFYESICLEKNKVVTSENKAALEAQINESLPTGSPVVTLNVGDIVNAMEFISNNNKELWKQFLWKLTAEAVLLLSVPEGFVQFGSEGTVHNQPPAGPINNTSIVSPELRTVKWATDKKLMDRIDPLTASMHQWICKKKKAEPSKYPLYEKKCECEEDGISYKRKTSFIAGIYDDEDKKHNNCCR